MINYVKNNKKRFSVKLTHIPELIIARCVKSADREREYCVTVSFVNIKSTTFYTLCGRPFLCGCRTYFISIESQQIFSLKKVIFGVKC